MNRIDDEKMDKMLSTLFNYEVPEEMQFHEQKTSEKNISAKKINHGNLKHVFSTAAVCMAAALFILPVVFLKNSPWKTEVKSDNSLSEIEMNSEICQFSEEFKEAVENYSFMMIPLESSSYYRAYEQKPYFDENNPETGMLMSLKLIPYKYEETKNSELYVRVAGSGDRTVYTRDAFFVKYDENQKVTEVIRSAENLSKENETVPEDPELFKGAVNSREGFEKIVSKFKNSKNDVVFDGVTVRKKLSENSEYTVSDRSWYAYVKIKDSFVPVCLYELSYEAEGNAVPDGYKCDQVSVYYEKGKTKCHSVLMYDCSKAVSVRKDNVDPVWNVKHQTECPDSC